MPEVVTGSGINQDILNWFNSFGNYDLGDRRLQLDNRAQSEGTALSLMELQQRARQIDDQYELDKERLGLDRANLLRQQRMDAASMDLADRQLALDTEFRNFQQRDALVGHKRGIIDMLSARTGPQDWVKYNSMLNLLDPPTPDRSQSLDVFSILDGLVEESEVRKPGLRRDLMGGLPVAESMSTRTPASTGPAMSWSDALAQVQRHIPTSPNTVNYGGAPSAPLPAPTGQNTFAPTTPGVSNVQLPRSDLFSGIRNEDVSYLNKTGMRGLHTTGAGGTSLGGDYTNFKVFDPATNKQYGASDVIDPGKAVWLERLFKGGMSRLALAGDGPGKRMNEDTEMIIAPQGALVLNPSDTKKMMKKMKAKPKRMNTGGTIGGGAADGSDVTFNQYSPEQLGAQPFLKKIRSLGQGFTGGFGNALSNPKLGISNMPFGLNLQAFGGLQDSEQAALKETYNTGLGVYWDDLYANALKAAPRGRTLATAFYGG